MADRRRLPNRRASRIVDFEHRNIPFCVGYSMFPGTSDLAELFIMPRTKESDLNQECSSASTSLSISLQCGTPLAAVRAALPKHANGKPCSILGEALAAIARDLAADD